MTIQANAQGVAVGKFQIPANVPAGVKRVEFSGSGGSRGEATFIGQGTLVSQVRQLITTVTEQRWWQSVDPLAQTFSLPSAAPVGGVDLWFTAKGTSPVVVQIRGVTAGVPNNVIYAEGRVNAADIATVGHTRIPFNTQVWIEANTEYAIVVLCNDAVAELAIAELGKWDTAAGKWVASQAYQVGVLLSSSNASTWTPHQDRDMTFRLLKAVYSQTQRTVALGKVAVTNATDLLLLALASAPTFDSSVEYALGLPGGTTLTVAEGQPVRLPAAVTGDITVSAKLSGTAAASPVLHPGTQMISGQAALTADYVSVGIPAGTNSRVRVIMDATLPSGAGVVVKVSGIDAGDTYQIVPFLSSAPLTSEKQELIYEITGVNEAVVKVKLDLSGTSAARPLVENLRVIVL